MGPPRPCRGRPPAETKTPGSGGEEGAQSGAARCGGVWGGECRETSGCQQRPLRALPLPLRCGTPYTGPLLKTLITSPILCRHLPHNWAWISGVSPPFPFAFKTLIMPSEALPLCLIACLRLEILEGDKDFRMHISPTYEDPQKEKR